MAFCLGTQDWGGHRRARARLLRRFSSTSWRKIVDKYEEEGEGLMVEGYLRGGAEKTWFQFGSRSATHRLVKDSFRHTTSFLKADRPSEIPIKVDLPDADLDVQIPPGGPFLAEACVEDVQLQGPTGDFPFVHGIV